MIIEKCHICTNCILIVAVVNIVLSIIRIGIAKILPVKGLVFF